MHDNVNGQVGTLTSHGESGGLHYTVHFCTLTFPAAQLLCESTKAKFARARVQDQARHCKVQNWKAKVCRGI